MSRTLQVSLGSVTILILLAGPAVVACHQLDQMRNFHVVRDGVLYRSGQMTLKGLARVVHDHGIRTVISLRDGTTSSDQQEEAWCRKQEIKFIRIPPRPWQGPGEKAPIDTNIATFQKVMADPANYPVLVHCFAGIHRTGAYCAIYRMEFEGWNNHQAMAEMKAYGYDTLDKEKDIKGYLENYQPQRAGQQKAN